MSISIEQDNLSRPQVAVLLQAHLDFAGEHTPAGSGHALDVEALKRPELTFWTAWRDDELLGCIALADLGQGHGEIKSMHTAKAHRGQGIARKLVQYVIDMARQRNMTRISLETGRSEGFKPSRLLYESMGFEPCEPFGAYAADPFSYCMTRGI